jgi:prolipoprotein diacylglyceryltransferase
MAGCCYGILAPTTHWAITFTNPESTIPSYLLGLPLHPTQIYFSLASFCIFLFLSFFSHLFVSKAGQLTCMYLILESLSRFTIDFWRGDRGNLIELTFFNRIELFLSTPQLYSLIFFVVCIIGLCFISFRKSKK